MSTLSERDWIEANPCRIYRITFHAEDKADAIDIGRGKIVVPATVLDVSPGRKIWGTQDIYAAPNTTDSDFAIKLALDWYNTAFLPMKIAETRARRQAWLRPHNSRDWVH